MIRDLHTVAQFANNSPFSEHQLRFWIQHAARNGLEAQKAVVRVGARRVYIDPAAFERWVASQNGGQGEAA
jgi:hypothetical protein